MILLPLLVLAGASSAAASRHCTSCNLTAKTEARQVEMLAAIKQKLGFNPDVVRKIPTEVLKKAQELARRLHADKDDSVLKDEVHLFAQETDDEESNGVRFLLQNDTKGRSVQRADLHLYLAQPEAGSTERREVTITVHDTTESGLKGELLASHRVLTPNNAHGQHRIRLNSEAMERISQHTVATLIVEALLDGENLAVLPGDDDAADHPLSLSLVLAQSRRSRRSTNQCQPDKPTQSCCTFAHEVDLEKLGWEFVVMPTRLYITGCAGHCNNNRAALNLHGEPSRQAVLESAGLTAGGCCHPTEYASMQFIYVTPSDNVVNTIIERMEVLSCGCS